jgi:hypothetical protein
VERDLRSQLSGGERGLVEEYVEKVPNPSLKSEWGCPRREGLRGRKASQPASLSHCFLPAPSIILFQDILV